MAIVDELSLKLLLALREAGAARFTELRRVVRNPKTLAARLRRLESAGVIERSGRRYKLTAKGEAVAGKLAELDRLLRCPPVSNVDRIPHALLAPVVRRLCEALYEVLGERLVSVVLFGSVARGDWTRDSDIDLLVVADGWDGKPVWERLRELRGAEDLLEASPEYSEAVAAGYAPAIQPYPLSTSEARKFNRIYLDAALDGIILFDRGGFIAAVLRELRRRLQELGARRVELPDGRYYWLLKPDLKPGEVVELG